MPLDTLQVVRGHLTGDAPLDTAVSRAILQQVTSGELNETLQVGTPHHVVAFGKHDRLSPGFTDAVAIARSHGYDASIRIAGGRAVTFSPSILRFAWTVPSDDPAKTMHARFATLSAAVVCALLSFDVESEVGEVPNEYCAGKYSVRVLGNRKVMGVGQRLSRTAAQVGGMIVISDADEINEVLVPVYRTLAVEMDPAVTGSIADVARVTAIDVAEALVAEIAEGRPTRDMGIGDATFTLARQLRPDHEPPQLA